MSVKAVRDFWEKVQRDPKLRQQLEGLKGGGKDPVVPAVVRIAAAAGFEFSAAEYESAVKEQLARQHAASQLQDEELDGVSGGLRFGVPIPRTLITCKTMCAKCDDITKG